MKDRSKLAKLISKIYQSPNKVDKLLSQSWIPKHSAHVIGVTGSTAVGKSTLIDKIIKIIRMDNLSIIVLAIDPTANESGGAVLGDTIRMRSHYLDPEVFMRSFGARGATAALTKSLREIIKTASRFANVVIVETAGAGQSDTSINDYTDTLIVLPETRADYVNLLKAGPHHYAHILVVNMRTEEDERFLSLADSFSRTIESQAGWKQCVFGVNAITGEGVAELVRQGIYVHRDFLKKTKMVNPPG